LGWLIDLSETLLALLVIGAAREGNEATRQSGNKAWNLSLAASVQQPSPARLRGAQSIAFATAGAMMGLERPTTAVMGSDAHHFRGGFGNAYRCRGGFGTPALHSAGRCSDGLRDPIVRLFLRPDWSMPVFRSGALKHPTD